ncbi:MAG: prepilin-type cleavage/methylation domain-containing protein [Rhodospirillum sp.]|nr:prepilin-type cleavage/methylation domain-containing protein [Rhodospirillum sp.]MCF8489340.1 prepilin-type cleavage/methylation domain-containing protein [Rhodospirillum sp.]MCF8502999.1 prepilin-type cleavage/methylation domain-containing protein [Rhodospirillum sp.]
MALALAVLGLLGAAGFAAATALRATNAHRATMIAFDRVEAALTRAVLTDGALPCPDSRDAPDGRPDQSWCDRVGLVPWRALGLSLADGIDGWDNRLSYAISPSVASLDMGGTSYVPGYAPMDCAPEAKALNRNIGLLPLVPGEERPTALPSSGAAFALVSHGPNGKGAILANGRPNPAGLEGATRAERETIAGRDLERRIWTRPAAHDLAPEDGTARDDLVRWRTPLLLLLAAGCRLNGPGG